MNYALGRRTPKRARALHFATLFRTGALPVHPPAYDSIDGWTGWQMLGNDKYGVCVAVSWSTDRRILSGGASYPAWDQVEALYETQNPGFPKEDNGMDIQTVLEYLVKQGGPDGVKAVAFAKVDHTNFEEMKAALATFKTLWLGVNVTDDNQNQFPGTPWTPTGPVEGGHSIIATGYTNLLVKMETWAAEGSLSEAFVVDGTGSKPGLEEAWVVIWPEHLTSLSEDAKAALAVAYQDVTGDPITWPGDTPTPSPTPAPDEDFAALKALLHRARHIVHECETWLEAKGL